MTQPEVIYAHARNLISGILTNLLKMPLNFDLHAKCSRLVGNRCRGIHLRPEVELLHLLRMRRHYRHKSRRKWCRAPDMTTSL